MTLAVNLGETMPSNNAIKLALMKINDNCFNKNPIPIRIISRLAILFKIVVVTFFKKFELILFPIIIDIVIDPDKKEIKKGLVKKVPTPSVWINMTKIGVNPPKRPFNKDN